MAKPSYLYVTYTATTAEKLWGALLETDQMRHW